MDQEIEQGEEDQESESSGAISPVEILKFLVAAAKRHWRLGVVCAVSIASVGVAVALIMPAKYETESRILLVQSAAVTAALSVGPDGRLPTLDAFAGSSELMTQKSNLAWIVEKSDLLRSWKQKRTLLFRLKDRAMASVMGEAPDSALSKVLVDLLHDRMWVNHDATVLTIHVTWQDPEDAQKLTQLAQFRFLEMRRTQELAAIQSAITLNEGEVKRAADEIDRSLDVLMKIREKRRTGARFENAEDSALGAASPPAAQNAVRAPNRLAKPRSPDLDTPTAAPPVRERQLATKLAELRQREREIAEPWQRRIAELKFHLEDLRGTYGPEHPLVRQQEAKIRESSDVPAELAGVRDSEQQLLAEIARAQPEDSASAPQMASPGASTARAPYVANSRQQRPTASGMVVITEREEDPTLAPAAANLKSAISTYGDATRRLENARLQLATSQIALDSRYVVIAEPELPKRPTKPNRPVLVGGALVAAAFLGFLVGALRDLLTGKIFEAWQVRSLGLDVLAEVELTRLRR